MNITDIISVSPVNPAHGRHEIHARTNENIDITFTIGPIALGCLCAYFDHYPESNKAYHKWLDDQSRATTKSSPKKGS